MRSSQLTVGAGKSGISFKLSVKNQQGFAAIFLHFDATQIGLYHTMKKNIAWYRKNIHKDITASKRKIGVVFEPDTELDFTISMITSIFKRMLKYFGSYIYGDCKQSGVDGVEKLDHIDKFDEIRNWTREGLRGVHSKIEELLLEEVDNERAFQANKEKVSEYLMNKCFI